MSFESLVKKLMKEGKSKTAATKIAGSVANAKMKGAGSGPTAKQKARAKAPTTKKPRLKKEKVDFVKNPSKKGVLDKITVNSDGTVTAGKKMKRGKAERKQSKGKGTIASPINMKSPATKKPKPRAVIRDKDRVADKSRSYTDKKGRKIEIKTFKAKKRYDSGVKDDPNEPSMKRKSSRLSNTVELHKTKTKKDGTTKTKVKRAAGGGKKSQRLHTKFAKGKNKEGASDVTITRKSPTTMKQDKTERIRARKNKVNEKLDKTSVYKEDKKNTVTGKKINPKFKRLMDKETNLTDKLKKAKSKANTEKSPATKPLKGKQKSLPKRLREAILKSPGKMLSESGIKMMQKQKSPPPTTMKSKQRVEQDYARNAIADYESGDKKAAKYEKKKALEVAAGESPSTMKNPKMKKRTTKSVASIGEKSYGKKVTRIGGNKTKTKEVYSEPGYSEIKKSKTKKDNVGYTSTKNSKKVIQREKPGKKAAKKMIRKGASTVFESSMGSAIMMKTNQSGGAYAAKNPAAPARQLKKLGSVLSKHFKSNM